MKRKTPDLWRGLGHRLTSVYPAGRLWRAAVYPEGRQVRWLEYDWRAREVEDDGGLPGEVVDAVEKRLRIEADKHDDNAESTTPIGRRYGEYVRGER